MLTLTYHVQPNPGEDHVGPSHVHLLWATWTTAKPQQQTRRQSNGIWNGISTEKSKIMTNNMNNTSADISMDGQKLEEVISSKYLSVTLRKDGTCSTEVLIRISQAMAAVARLSRIWLCNIISFASKFKLYKSLVISTFLCGCKILTLLSDFEKKKKKKSRFSKPDTREKFFHLLFGAQDQRLGVEQDQLPCRSTGISSGNCQDTETCMVRACYIPRMDGSFFADEEYSEGWW